MASPAEENFLLYHGIPLQDIIRRLSQGSVGPQLPRLREVLYDWLAAARQAESGFGGGQVIPKSINPFSRHLLPPVMDLGSRLNVGPVGPWSVFPGGIEGWLAYMTQNLGLPAAGPPNESEWL